MFEHLEDADRVRLIYVVEGVAGKGEVVEHFAHGGRMNVAQQIEFDIVAQSHQTTSLSSCILGHPISCTRSRVQRKNLVTLHEFGHRELQITFGAITKIGRDMANQGQSDFWKAKTRR